MGAILHVNVYYSDLKTFAHLAVEKSIPVYGTVLSGESIYSQKLGARGIILLGNESRGISSGVQKFVTHPVTIPRFGKAESLNASTATAVILDNLHRGYKNF